MTRSRELADLLTGGQTITTDDNTAQLTLESTDTDASVGPVLNLSRDNSSAADNDLVGEVQFNADDDANNQTTYGKILTVIEDASNGSEDGLMQIHTNVAGTLRDRIKITSSEMVLNEESIDSDFRVESNGDTHMLFVDGGTDRVGIGKSGPEATFHVVGDASDLNDSNTIRVEAGDAGGNRGINIGQVGDGSQARMFLQGFHSQSVTNYWDLCVNPNGGFVTMGTDNPSMFNSEGTNAGLTVAGSDTSTTVTGNGGAAINIVQTDGTAGNTAGLHFSRQDTDGTPNYTGAAIVAKFVDAQATGEYPKGSLYFNTSTTANAAPSEKMRIEPDGAIHILGEGSNTTSVTQGVCKQWVKYDSTGTVEVDDSFNTSSVTDNATGDARPQINNDFANVHYATSGSCNEPFGATTIINITSYAVGSYICFTQADASNTRKDVDFGVATSFGDLS